MTQFRDYLIIITTFSAILIALSGFFLNFAYDMIFNDFTLGIKQTSKKDNVNRILLFLGILFYATIIVFIIVNSHNTLNVKATSSTYITSKYTTFSANALIIVCIVYLLSYLYIKFKFIKIVNNKKISNLSLLLMFAIALSVICICTSVVGVYKEVLINNNISRISVYRDDLYIGAVLSKQKIDISLYDDVEIKMNDLIITNGKTQFANQLKKGVFSLVYDSKRFFINNSNDNSTIEIVEGDMISLIIKNAYVGNLTYKNAINFDLISIILRLIMLVLTFYSLVFLGFGLKNILEKLSSIKNSLILLESSSLYGKILVQYDDFYVIYSNNEYVYIPKSKIVSINPLEINKKLNEKHKAFKEFLKFKKKQ
ncbi:hypothetical protein [Clostridium tagluense]|uniref:hypothetical protein n=1 Tax=Clostridium tagluense TaxID=360422 RepID=UPI001C6DE60E|nr:hypothetical protein [Clostridium tagluense]MBW9158730.1 hypothetical protein [Clostridium tagluense]WLC67399.1 hypothetical protein KTC93_09570 [Clostridium tagluense]